MPVRLRCNLLSLKFVVVVVVVVVDVVVVDVVAFVSILASEVQLTVIT